MQLVRIILLALFVGHGSLQAQTQPQPAPASRPIALNEAIALALQHNLDIQIERYNPQLALLDLNVVYGGYDPNFNFRAQQSFSSSAGRFEPTLGFNLPSTETFSETFSTGLGGTAPGSGTRYDISASINRTSGTFPGAGGSVINRDFQYNPRVQLSVTQPLLKDFWIDGIRYQIALNKKNVQISEYLLSRQIMDIITRVEQAYYELIFARENVKVQEKALELAQRSLSENKRRVEVGALAPLDEKQAESLVASSKADLLVAQRTLSVQENSLKNLLTDEYSSMHDVALVPSEGLLPTVVVFDLQESWKRALTSRPDLLQSRTDLEKRDITLKYQHNQLFPALDLLGTYGRNGLPQAEISPSLDGISRGDNPFWTIGAQLSIPVGNRAARYRYRVSKAEKAQAILQLKRLEQTIMVEVDNGVKLAQANFERITASREARVYAEAALDAEQKKLENGKSTSFVVLQLQRDLTLRRSQEIRALADYNNTLANLSFSEGQTMERHSINLNTRK